MPVTPLLQDWQSFYMVVGTAAATLTGLMFVATSLVAGAERNSSTLDAGISAFNTPTVMHFGAVLFIAVVLSAPWRGLAGVRLVLGLFGIAMVVYVAVVARRMSRVPNYRAPLKDWLWYALLPLAAYILLIAGAALLAAMPVLALYLAAAALGVLFLSIHNTWDLVSYFAVIHAQVQARRKR